jgi:hypothetical protein
MPLEEFLRDYRPRRVREPGLVTSYSNYSTALAGAAVAAVEGTQWQTLIERDILAPLRLEHMSGREPYSPRADLPAPIAAGLAQDFSDAFRWNGVAHVTREFELVTQAAPAGAMSSSASDMARYMLLLLGDGTLDGVSVFGETAARAFRTPFTSLPRGVGALDGGFFAALQPGGFMGYGHGGSTLSFFSNLVVVPELDLGIFATTNTEGGGQVSNPLAGRIIEHFYGAPRAAPSGPAPELAGSAAVYAGDYVATRRRYGGGLEAFVSRLVSAASVGVTSEGYLLVSGALGPAQRYVPAGEPNVFRPANAPSGAGGMLRFHSDGGRAERIEMIPLAFERVRPWHRPLTLSLSAALAAFTALAIVVGFFVRLSSRLPESRGQAVARRVQLAAAALWLTAVAAFALWIAGIMGDATPLFSDWPGPLLLTASSAALAASVSTLLGIPLLAAVWRRTADSTCWSPWRKVRYTAALAIFAAFALVLGAWGALAPWAG